MMKYSFPLPSFLAISHTLQSLLDSAGVTLDVFVRAENLAERGPLRTVWGSLANTQKKYLKTDGESGCGWLF